MTGIVYGSVRAVACELKLYRLSFTATLHVLSAGVAKMETYSPMMSHHAIIHCHA